MESEREDGGATVALKLGKPRHVKVATFVRRDKGRLALCIVLVSFVHLYDMEIHFKYLKNESMRFTQKIKWEQN